MNKMDNIYKWRKQNQVRIYLELNKNSEDDVIQKLESVPNKRQYLIGLVRKDLNARLSADVSTSSKEKEI
ncbi:MAG: hypothetical protein KBT35_01325 [Firmicutes bacterium]|nr:hypothetical protein [Candidatus Colivicinus equi]